MVLIKDPRRYLDGSLLFFFLKTFKVYENEDTGVKQKKGITDNRPLKSTRPCPDRISNGNERTRMRCIFISDSTLKVHQEINNSGKHKKKYHLTWKHPLLQKNRTL